MAAPCFFRWSANDVLAVIVWRPVEHISGRSSKTAGTEQVVRGPSMAESSFIIDLIMKQSTSQQEAHTVGPGETPRHAA